MLYAVSERSWGTPGAAVQCSKSFESGGIHALQTSADKPYSAALAPGFALRSEKPQSHGRSRYRTEAPGLPIGRQDAETIGEDDGCP